MAMYRTIRTWSYNPRGLEESWITFDAGETFAYPGLQFPTVLPIAELLADGVVEEAAEETIG